MTDYREMTPEQVAKKLHGLLTSWFNGLTEEEKLAEAAGIISEYGKAQREAGAAAAVAEDRAWRDVETIPTPQNYNDAPTEVMALISCSKGDNPYKSGIVTGWALFDGWFSSPGSMYRLDSVEGWQPLPTPPKAPPAQPVSDGGAE